MLKKLAVVTAILAASSTIAFAAGPYVGAGIGVQATTSSGGSARVAPATLSAGYGSIVSQSFYLAGEAFVVPGSLDLNDNNARTTYGYGASILPGLMVNDSTMTYVRAGVVRSHFDKQNKNRTGGQLGLGIQTSLTQCLDLRGEYVYTAYQSVSSNNGNYLSSPKGDQFNLGLIYKFE